MAERTVRELESSLEWRDRRIAHLVGERDEAIRQRDYDYRRFKEVKAALIEADKRRIEAEAERDQYKAERDKLTAAIMGWQNHATRYHLWSSAAATVDGARL